MKSLLSLTALCLTVALFGCTTTQDSKGTGVAPAAVSDDCGANCTKPCCDKPCAGDKDASMGAVGDKPACSGKGASECPYSKGKSDTSMGAMGDGAPSCCPASKSHCTGGN